MRIALIQQHAGPDKADNLARGMAATRAAAAAGAQVVCFAELAFEPFYPQVPAAEQRWAATPRALAEPVPGPTTTALQALARECEVVLVPNLYERDGVRAFDTSLVIDADGALLGRQRMLHITEQPTFHEQGYYDPGDLGTPVFATRYGRIGVAICYDRHYPEVMRGLALGGAEVVFVPEAGGVDEWPEGLHAAEMRVAAFQNGMYVALCNRVGREQRIEFGGESYVCGPDGCEIARAGRGTDEVLHADLDLGAVPASVARRLFLRDRRPELYADWLSRA